jgi:hypothetical protein
MIACRAATSLGSWSGAKVIHGFYPNDASKDSFILLKTNDESRNPTGWRTPRRPPPIDSLPQHRELGGGQPNHTVRRRWPGETAPLEDLVIQAKTLLVPIQKFDSVALSPTEGEDCTRAGILPKHLLCRSGKACDPFPHIRDAAGDINPNAGARTDHVADSTAATKRRISWQGSVEGRRSVRPWRSSIEIKHDTSSSTGNSSASSSSQTSTGSKSTTAKVSDRSCPDRKARRH